MKTYLSRAIRNKYLVKVSTVNNNSDTGYLQDSDIFGIVIITEDGQEKAIRWESIVDITTIKK